MTPCLTVVRHVLRGGHADGMTVAAAVNMHPEQFGAVCLIEPWLDLLAPQLPHNFSEEEVRDAIGNTKVHLPFSPCTALSSHICFH